MKSGSILDANLEALLKRAWAPVHAAPGFRERVGAEFVAAVGALGQRRGPARDRRAEGGRAEPVARGRERARARARSSSRSSAPGLAPGLRWTLVAAAAALLLFVGRTLFFGTRPEGASLEALLARGVAAARTTADGEWSALETLDELARAEFTGGYLELATPAELPALVSFAAPGAAPASADGGERWSVFPSSRLVLRRAEADAVSAELQSGGLRARRGGAAPTGRRVETEQGSLALAGAFDVRVAIEPPDEPGEWPPCSTEPARWTHVVVRGGGARVPASLGTLELGPGEERFLCSGVALEPRDPQAAGGPGRSEVDAADDDRAHEPADARRVLVRGAIVADGEPVTSFAIVALEFVSLPQVASPSEFRFESAAGGFELREVDGERPGLRAGSYSLYAKAPGWPVERREVRIEAGPLDAPVDVRFELRRGGRVEGLVVDADSGIPIAGAYVVSEHDSQLAVLAIAPEDNGDFARFATTRPGGDFALAPLSAGTHSLRASAPGYGPSWVEVRDLLPDEARAGVTFRLQRAGALAGVVLDAGRAPVAGAIVLASTTDFERKRPSLTYARVIADSEGRYRIDDLGEGAWAVMNFGARAGELAPAYQFARVVSGQTTRLDFRPPEELSTLAGRLLDAEGRPVAGRTVMAGSDDGTESPSQGGWTSGNSDRNGDYRIRGLRPGRYELYVSGATPAEMLWVGQVDVAGATTEHDLRLEGVALRGRVTVGGSDAALSFAVVVALETSQGKQRFQGRVFTQADGTYQFDHLPPGVYDVFAYATRGDLGQEQQSGVVVDGTRDRESVDFALFPGGRIAVRVVDESGAPQAAALRFVDERGVRVQFSEEDRADGAGRCSLRGVKPGSWTVTATRAGFRPASGVARVRVGETVEIELTLRPQ